MPIDAPPSSTSSSAEVLELPLDLLEDSPFQVKQYDTARVRDLAETIRRQGLLQPATVRSVDGRYQLISGHARRAALRSLRDTATTDTERERFSRIRCLLLPDIDDARAAALTAIENLQRDDGTPLEQALMVARARDAGKYRNIPETAEALGLPLGRVRQFLLLADAPAVLQRAVSPGVLVSREGGGRERLPLAVTSVLAVRPYDDFLFESRLAELKGAAAARRRRDERRGRIDDSPETRAREATLYIEEAAAFAAERTERMLSAAARHLWTVADVQARVRRATRPERAGVEPLAPAAEPPDGLVGPEPEPTVPRLYSERRGRLTVWPGGIPGAAAAERTALAGKLRSLLQALDG
jgi:ParB/RepB/Spo0J family partition protein